jgi:hypothetical protein
VSSPASGASGAAVTVAPVGDTSDQQLSAVDADLSGIDAATTQADTDVAAADSALTQSDNP